MQVHLTLLDHAVTSAAESLRAWKAEDRRADDKRDPFRLAHAVHQAHLAVEKLLKHVVSEVDPCLLLEQASPKFIRELRRDALGQRLPSIFASRRYLATSNAEQAWSVLLDVLTPDIPTDVIATFGAALKALSLLRNQAQHGELYADTAELLSALERIYSKLPEVAIIVCPEFLARLEKRRPVEYAELRGIEAKVDAAWWTLREQLRRGRRIVIPLSIHVTWQPNLPTLRVFIDRASTSKDTPAWTTPPGQSSLTLIANVEPRAASGFFARPITEEEASQRSEARREVVRQRLARRRSPELTLASPPPPPRPSGLLALFGVSQPADSLRDALMAAYERERAYIEKYGVPALENGHVTIEATPASVIAPLRKRTAGHLTGDVLVDQLTITLGSRKSRGEISGRLLPRRGGQPEGEAILVTGKAWLTTELVVPTDAASQLPPGTVIRYLSGEVRLRLARPPGEAPPATGDPPRIVGNIGNRVVRQHR